MLYCLIDDYEDEFDVEDHEYDASVVHGAHVLEDRSFV